LPPVVVFGFVRIGTSGRIFRNPMAPAEASAHVRSWLAQPAVRIVEPAPDHIMRVLSLLEALGTAANLVTDVQIAALAVEQGAVLHTADADFLRIPGLGWFNPITGTASRGTVTSAPSKENRMRAKTDGTATAGGCLL
jgi:hypothetical protein